MITDLANATPCINTGGLQDFPKKQKQANLVRGFGVVHARKQRCKEGARIYQPYSPGQSDLTRTYMVSQRTVEWQTRRRVVPK